MLARTVPALLLGLTVFGVTTGLTAGLTVQASDGVAVGTTTTTRCDTDGIGITVAADPLLPTHLGSITVTGIAPACAGQWVYVAVDGTAVQFGAQHTSGTTRPLGTTNLLSGSMPLLVTIGDIDVVISEEPAA